MKSILETDNQKTTILIRLMVGAVFLSEGIQKFLFAEKLGSGRFEKLGLPSPEFLGPFVGSFEILCGTLVLLGLLQDWLPYHLLLLCLQQWQLQKHKLFANEGFWAMMHGSRTDWSMLLGSIFLLIRGGGRWSVDHKINK
jgi:putative oxidoreductase